MTDATGRDGATPLQQAAGSGRLQVVETLIEAGADVDARDRDRRTALHNAAGENHGDVIRRLLAAGADPTLRDRVGHTPLHAAAKPRRDEAVRLLRHALGDAHLVDQPNRRAPVERHSQITAILIHPSKPEAVTVSDFAQLDRWSLRDVVPNVLTGMQTPHGSIRSAAVSPDGRQVAVVVEPPDRVEFRRWDDLTLIGTSNLGLGDWASLSAVDFSADGRWLAVAGNGELIVLDRLRGDVADRSPAGDWLPAVRFDPSGSFLACAGAQGGEVLAFKRDGDGRWMLSFDLDRSGLEGRYVSPCVTAVSRVAFSPDGRVLAAFDEAYVHSNERTYRHRSVVTIDMALQSVRWVAPVDVREPTRSGDSWVDALADRFTTDVAFAGPALIAAGTADGAVLFFNVANGTLVGRADTGSGAAVVALGPCPVLGRLWVGCEDSQFCAVTVPPD